ncbi:MAG: DUF805 domain-containing protein [Zoogloeaceae bacterium]|jgi:uncharacterized membrane protein YhaH (DUF805 family)|nr:DUF805 domain-containing protein [Zoogloeaceae bacterium]
MKWYFKVLKQYADFGGRVRRREYWFFVLFNIIAAIVAMAVDIAAGWELTVDRSTGLPNYGPCYLTYVAAILLPGLAVSVRRLHDIGKNGWWLFISLIPLVGGIWLIVLFCTDGQDGENRYGANPKQSEPRFTGRREEKSIAIAFIMGAIVSVVGFLFNSIRYDLFTVILLILLCVLMLLFGALYYPARDAGKTAARRNIAFGSLAVAALISAVLRLSALSLLRGYVAIILTQYVWILHHLALLALAVLLLLKSGRKSLRLASCLAIAFSALSIVVPLAKWYMLLANGHTSSFNPWDVIPSIAAILLGARYLSGKAVAEDELTTEGSRAS